MTKEFLKDTALRCAWTFAEAMLGCVTVGQALTEINWLHALSISAVATIICLLKQIVKFAREHTAEEEYVDLQSTFNFDDIRAMFDVADDIEESDYEEQNDTAEE